MKKIILTLVIAFITVFTVNAQVATENAKLFDNTYVGVEVGATTPLDFNDVFFPVNTVAGIKLGKELTPVFGFEVEGTAGFGDNFDYVKSTKTFVKTTNVGLNGVLNWSNLLFGYRGTPRTFEVKTNTGLGWAHFYGTDELDNKNSLVAKTAVDFAFNLGKTKAHTITVSPGVYWDFKADDKIKFDRRYAQFGVFVGYAYHFKTSNKTHHFKTYDVGALLDENDRLKKELSEKPTEVVREVVKIVEVPVADSVAVLNTTKETVFFAFNSSKLDDNAKATLDKLGENGIYEVRGYASSEGSTKYNKALSLRRAEAVADYLRARGARVDTVEGLGVAFGRTTGRVAVVTIK